MKHPDDTWMKVSIAAQFSEEAKEKNKPSLSFLPKTVERHCERSKNNTDVLNTGRTRAVTKRRRVTPTIKVTFYKPVMENTRTHVHARNNDDLLSVSKDCLRQEKDENSKAEGEKHFLYHCSSTRTLTEEASLRTTTQQRQHNKYRFRLVCAFLFFFFFTLFLFFSCCCFFYALGLHSVVAGISSAPPWQKKKQNASHCTKEKKELCLFILDKLAGCLHGPAAPLQALGWSAHSFFFLTTKQVQRCPELLSAIFSLFSILLLSIFVYYYWYCCFLFLFFNGERPMA